ncbi:MAG: hypothetical protein FJX68_03665 [Alphaproteobacteria bacterium]|nr:hypothetical protein [Alphaproteobacteria bacterium]
MNLARTTGLAGLGLLVALGAQAETLNSKGARLAPVKVPIAAANVGKTVELGGDVPTASHVMASMPDGRSLQRTNQGYWLPWDGTPASLIDNGFQPTGGLLTFKVLKEDLTQRFLPVTVTVAYRAGGQLKFGVFDVVPE